MKILFVCLGNICRSPLAQAIAESHSQKHYFDSAGLSDFHQGSPPCEGSQKIAKMHHISLDHMRSRPVVLEKDDQFDLLVGMDEENQKALLKMGFAQNKVKKLGSFGLKGMDIPDPYYFTKIEDFEKIYQMIEVCIKNFLKEIDAKTLGNQKLQ